MRVAQLARLLDSLVHGLDGVVGGSLTGDLRSFAEAMQAFANASVAEFSVFLGQFGLEFQQTGKITAQGKIALNKPARAPKPDAAQQVANAVAAVKDLFAEIDRGTVDDNRVAEILKPVAKLTVVQLHQVLTGLDIAEKPKTKPKIVDKIRQVVQHQLESRDRSRSAGGRDKPLAGHSSAVF
jgi:hypothetical protein